MNNLLDSSNILTNSQISNCRRQITAFNSPLYVPFLLAQKASLRRRIVEFLISLVCCKSSTVFDFWFWFSFSLCFCFLVFFCHRLAIKKKVFSLGKHGFRCVRRPSNFHGSAAVRVVFCFFTPPIYFGASPPLDIKKVCRSLARRSHTVTAASRSHSDSHEHGHTNTKASTKGEQGGRQSREQRQQQRQQPEIPFEYIFRAR